jgi:hypothetical protein
VVASASSNPNASLFRVWVHLAPAQREATWALDVDRFSFAGVSSEYQAQRPMEYGSERGAGTLPPMRIRSFH